MTVLPSRQMHCERLNCSPPSHDFWGRSFARTTTPLFRQRYDEFARCQVATIYQIQKRSWCSRARPAGQVKCTQGASAFVVCASSAATDSRLTAESGDYVKVSCSGTFEGGEEFDHFGDGSPPEFVVGTGKVLKGLEAAVRGLKVGEEKKETVPPEDAFGEWREEMILKVPQSDIPPDLKLQMGERVMLGNGLEATVREVSKEETVLDCNPPNAGRAVNLEVKLMELTKADSFAIATFGAGCFWGPELLFARVPGVLITETGYSQGSKKNPTYDDVCSGLTGHNEVVKVIYDPQKVEYGDLLEVFISNHNPTQVDAQGRDTGSQYRSGIYTHTVEQKHAASEFLQRAQSRFQEPIATEVEEVQNYWPAESYHQQYLAKGGRFGKAQSSRKGCNDPIRCYG